MLKLVGGELGVRTCDRCDGRGFVPCPKTFSVRTNVRYSGGEGYGSVMQASAGARIPCPECRGKKVVPTPRREGGRDEPVRA